MFANRDKGRPLSPTRALSPTLGSRGSSAGSSPTSDIEGRRQGTLSPTSDTEQQDTHITPVLFSAEKRGSNGVGLIQTSAGSGDHLAEPMATKATPMETSITSLDGTEGATNNGYHGDDDNNIPLNGVDNGDIR